MRFEERQNAKSKNNLYMYILTSIVYFLSCTNIKLTAKYITMYVSLLIFTI